MNEKKLPEWVRPYLKSKTTRAIEQASVTPPSTLPKKRWKRVEERTARKREDLEDLLTVKEAASKMRCDETHVRDLIRSRQLRCQPDGRKRLIPVSAISEYFAAQQRKFYGSTG